MKLKSLLLAASIGALVLTGACKQMGGGGATGAALTADDGTAWGSFMQKFLDGYFKVNPTFAVYQGRHEFDGKLPDWSPEGLKAQIDYRKKAISDAKAMDANKLDDKQRFERDYLVSKMEGEIFWLESADQPHSNPASYVDDLDPNVYIARPYADATTRMKAFIAYAKNIPTAAAQIKANLKLPLPATFVKYGQAGFGGFADYYVGDAKKAFAEVKDAALQKEFDDATAKASAAMKDLSAYVGSKPATPGGFALGAAKFSEMVAKTEGVNISLDELEAIGKADLKRNQDALKDACSRFAPGADLAACMLKMGERKSPMGRWKRQGSNCRN